MDGCRLAMSPPTAPKIRRLGREHRPAVFVAAITTGLAAFTVTLCLDARPAAAIQPNNTWLVAAITVVAFFAAERIVFNVEYRRESVSFSLSEVPLAIALVFLGPFAAIGARLIGSLAAHLVGRKPTPMKLVFNAWLFAAETGLAFRLRAALATPRAGRGDLLLALLVAIAVASALGGIMVSLAVACFEGNLWHRLVDELGAGLIVYTLGAVVGVVGLAPSLVDWRLAILPAIPIAVVWRLLYTRGVLAQRFRDLDELHAFTDTVGHSLSLDAVVAAACEEIRRLLRAEHAAVVAFDTTNGHVAGQTVLGQPGPLPFATTDPQWAGLLDHPTTRTLGDDATSPLNRAMQEAGRVEALVAPVRDDQGILGLIVLANRTGAHDRFSDDDRNRLNPLVAQLAIALRKVNLHQQVEREATHDRLTGLPGRALLETALDTALRSGSQVGVFMLDIDRFKEINDTLGHYTGDAVLREFAHRVTSVLGPGDILARFAGDEFAIVAHPCTPDRGEVIAHHVLDQLRQPFDVGELTIAVACSIGVACSSYEPSDGASLLRRADLAMYDAKGRSSGFEAYRPDMDAHSADQLALLAELRVALLDDPDQIEVHFQPKIELATDRVVGCEALVRWQHPRHGLLAADRFIALAERTELIHRLSDIVLTQSLRAVHHWRDQGLHIGVAVNYSARTLFDELLADRIARQLELHSIPPDLLTPHRSHRIICHDRRRTRHHRAPTPPRSRRQDLRRRLRHRLLLRRLPTTTPRHRTQDRPRLHHEPAHRTRRRSHRPFHHRPRQTPRTPNRRRRHRSHPRRSPPPHARLPHRTGLRLLPPTTTHQVRRLARHRTTPPRNPLTRESPWGPRAWARAVCGAAAPLGRSPSLLRRSM